MGRSSGCTNVERCLLTNGVGSDMKTKAQLFLTLGAVAVSLILILSALFPSQSCTPNILPSKKFVSTSHDGTVFEYSRESPLIFVGGVPRSGTTLMRALLDTHPDVRCGEETRIIPKILDGHQRWRKSVNDTMMLEEAGVSREIMNLAISAFMLEIIVKHGEPAKILCNKDPLAFKHGTFLKELFPNSKFILMIRDGRATVHSIVEKFLKFPGMAVEKYTDFLKFWNSDISDMYKECTHLGPNTCMPVYYEQLVLEPKLWMSKILLFLDLPWDTSVLHHQDFVDKVGGISLSKLEKSSDQVRKPVNLEGLTKWVGNIPEEVLEDMSNLAPMLAYLGYDPEAINPDYRHFPKKIKL